MNREAGAECLRDSLRSLRLARKDLARGDWNSAMVQLVAANRMHAISNAHGRASYERVSDLLRATQRALWVAVRSSERRAA